MSSCQQRSHPWFVSVKIRNRVQMLDDLLGVLFLQRLRQQAQTQLKGTSCVRNNLRPVV